MSKDNSADEAGQNPGLFSCGLSALEEKFWKFWQGIQVFLSKFLAFFGHIFMFLARFPSFLARFSSFWQGFQDFLAIFPRFSVSKFLYPRLEANPGFCPAWRWLGPPGSHPGGPFPSTWMDEALARAVPGMAVRLQGEKRDRRAGRGFEQTLTLWHAARRPATTTGSWWYQALACWTNQNMTHTND